VTDAILLALGHMSEIIALGLTWLGQAFGVDAATVMQNLRAAEEARPRFEQDSEEGPPTLLATFVAICTTLFFGAIAYLIFHRLIGRLGPRDDEEVEEVRDPAGRRRAGLLDLFRRSRRGDADADLDTRDPRAAIRLRYRRFQILMARAGLPRRVGETPEEFELAAAQALPLAQAHLARITSAYTLARYAESTSGLPGLDEVDLAVQGVRGALRDQANAGSDRGPDTPR
jgi:hypothetical protein